MSKKKKNVSYNEIPNLAEDWSLDKRNNLPYSGESVQNFIKKVFGEKAGEFYYDPNTVKYLIFADADSRDLYLEDREAHSDLLLGTFDAPANYTAEIHMITPSANAVLEGSTENYIDFTFDITNKSGGSTGESVLAKFTIKNSGNTKTITQIYNAGTSVHFLIDEYLSAGVNTISIVLTGRNTLASVMASVNFTVVALKISSDFSFATPVLKGDQAGILSVPYTLEGSGVKFLDWYIDGVKDSATDSTNDYKVTRTKNISVQGLSAGKHSVQVRPYITIGGLNFYGVTLYFDFVVAPAGENWETVETDIAYTLLGLKLSEPVLSSSLTVSTKQYVAINYKLGLYDWKRHEKNVTIADNGSTIQTIAMNALSIVEKDYTPLTSGNHILTFSAGENTASFTCTAIENNLGIHEEAGLI